MQAQLGTYWFSWERIGLVQREYVQLGTYVQLGHISLVRNIQVQLGKYWFRWEHISFVKNIGTYRSSWKQMGLVGNVQVQLGTYRFSWKYSWDFEDTKTNFGLISLHTQSKKVNHVFGRHFVFNSENESLLGDQFTTKTR